MIVSSERLFTWGGGVIDPRGDLAEELLERQAVGLVIPATIEVLSVSR